MTRRAHLSTPSSAASHCYAAPALLVDLEASDLRTWRQFGNVAVKLAANGNPNDEAHDFDVGRLRLTAQDRRDLERIALTRLGDEALAVKCIHQFREQPLLLPV